MAVDKIPVWLDCDPGHDDVFAILIACYHPALHLLGISTVFGNSTLENTTHNALSFLTAIGRSDVPVHSGASEPFGRPTIQLPVACHGASGLDGTGLLPVPKGKLASSSAVSAMVAALAAQPTGTAWLIATGPLTNVAAALAADPGLAASLAGISCMGGAVGGDFGPLIPDRPEVVGNWTKWAEFNILADPEAAHAVLSTVPRLILAPLDLTHQVLAIPAVCDRLLHGRAGDAETPLRRILHELLIFFTEAYKVNHDIPGPPLHDPVAVAAVLVGSEHEIALHGGAERFALHVVTDGTLEEALAGSAQTGRTIATPLPPGQDGVRIPRSIDVDRFWNVLEDCVERADAANAALAVSS